MYLVTIDGLNSYNGPEYGVNLFVLGLYDTKDLADKAVNDVVSKFSDDKDMLQRINVIEIEANKTLHIERMPDGYNKYETSVHIDDYIE